MLALLPAIEITVLPFIILHEIVSSKTENMDEKKAKVYFRIMYAVDAIIFISVLIYTIWKLANE